jgi:16S rRNA (cytidine1402-2'-O)-methyltransferase
LFLSVLCYQVADSGISGTLYIVATPIGNLEDMTHRAVRVLSEVSVIACEDTRQSHKLLEHFGIRKPTVSFHEHNEKERSAELIARLERGDDIALISDAGTPMISDPGYRLVRDAVARSIRIVPIPGPSAVIAALSASGLPTDSFRFAGFLPPKAGARRRVLESIRDEASTLVFYEAPHRIVECLQDVAAVMGTREVVVARELTKIHEEFIRGTAESVVRELSSRPALKGEITLLIAKSGRVVEQTGSIREDVEMLERAGVPRMEAMKQVARERGISKREVYAEMEKQAGTHGGRRPSLP